ncbi:uncharacterized protein V1516DRAFT_674238 [Lipomyces oligophaga]|uniref:uncharacterized protein n=1 Tax=Lipomyces oligophaga TaxID=45792 RepID=UPI0034CD70AA
MASSYVANPEYELPKDYFTEAELASDDTVQGYASAFVKAFESAIVSADASAFSSLFVEGGVWRDLIAFTNDYRAITSANILQAAKAVLKSAGAANPVFESGKAAAFKPFPGHSFINVPFTFENKIGPCMGDARLVKDSTGAIKAYVLLTVVDGVHGHPWQVLENRPDGGHNAKLSHDQKRAAEVADPKPTVLIVGAGHNGLDVAVRLNALGVPNLIIDRNPRVGDNWRTRYASLSLHDTLWGANLPYMTFPTTWPLFLSAGRLGNWMEMYAKVMDINVWNSSYVVKDDTDYDEATKTWNLTINKAGTPTKVSVKHIVMATGLGGGKPKMPAPFPGQEKFKNTITHSFGHKSGSFYDGKVALVVGSGSSGHDIALDLCNNGAKVTMLQRTPTFVMSIDKGINTLNKGLYMDNGPALEEADLISETVPKNVAKAYLKKTIPIIAELDKDILDGLHKAGFKTWSGPEGSGHLYLSMERNGGYYFDSGACEKIINGDIKIQGSEIDHFTEDSVVFKDGSTLQPEVVVFATGVTGFKESCAETLGDKQTKNLKQVWGLDEESELNSCFRDCGVPGVYFMVGALPLGRFNSKVVAVQILAEQLGIFGERYTIEKQKASA